MFSIILYDGTKPGRIFRYIVLYSIKEPPNTTQRPSRGGYQPPAMFLVLGGWLNGKMLENCTNSPETAPFFAGGTAREAGSLPYRGWAIVQPYR